MNPGIAPGVVLVIALLAAPVHGYTLLDGPMPRLGPLPAAPSTAAGAVSGPVVSGPAPVPDPDAFPPPPHLSAGPRLAPALTSRVPPAEHSDSGFAPGSAYSQQMERVHGAPATNIGTLLAPTLRVTVPLR